ncbi:hypothetical protein GPA10_24255 [Streptomyces sp. p1417]|uniref:SMI1/KNR4 family protein n=1 Tax=Streptomyces typhae TaxID=2681492 RepID=A0A6L6X1T8_9ACTN|nr:hypothetical protein [Streptomyces typhae]MVO87785.1 hypothetical protein [Streptomyces typhae]
MTRDAHGAKRMAYGNGVEVRAGILVGSRPLTYVEGTEMVWVERLLESTGRARLGLTINWDPAERALGVRLPDSYKELCEVFGHGTFSNSLTVDSVDPELVFDLVSGWSVGLRNARENGVEDGETDPFYEPHHLYIPGKGGLIPWGSGDTGDSFFWLVEEGAAPDDWPILGRVAEAETTDWQRYEVSVPEFVFRVLTDTAFRPFTLAPYVPEPTFTPAE